MKTMQEESTPLLQIVRVVKTLQQGIGAQHTDADKIWRITAEVGQELCNVTVKCSADCVQQVLQQTCPTFQISCRFLRRNGDDNIQEELLDMDNAL